MAPDPTVILTLGLLLAAGKTRLWLLIIPTLWCLASGATAWVLGYWPGLDANPRLCGMRGRCTGKSVEALLGLLSLCPYRLSVQRLEVCYKRTSGLDPLQVVPAEQNHYPPPSHP